MLNFVNLPDYQNRLLALLKLFEAPHAKSIRKASEKHRYQVLNIKPHSIREPQPVGKS
jgi:hypothetical protein